MAGKNYTRSIFFLLMFVCFVAFCGILKVTQAVTEPIAVSILLAFVFYPLVKRLRRLHVPTVAAILLIVFLIMVTLFILGNLLATSIRTIVRAYPRYEERFTTLYQLAAKTLRLPFDENSSLITNLWNQLNFRTTLQKLALTTSTGFVSAAKLVMVMLLFVVFLLLEMNSMREKVNTAFAGESRDKVISMTRHIITEITRYISIKFLVSLMTGFFVFVATAAIRMDFPILWGFIAFLLNFIPTFGSIISWSLTTLFGTLQFFPHWGYVVYIAVAVLLINMVLGNIVEPRWEGSDLGISPFVILVNLSLWGWLWGFSGMIVAVPLMVIVKIICENIEYLQPIAVFLGNSKSVKAQASGTPAQQPEPQDKNRQG